MPRWAMALWVRRAAAWTFVVVALVAGNVPWLHLGDGRTVEYRGSYSPFTDVTTSHAYSTTLEIVYDVGSDGPWVGRVSAIAAIVLLVAAVAQALLTRRSAVATLVTIAAAPLLVVAVTVAVNGIGGVSFAPLPAAAIVLAAVALHEAATRVARPPGNP